MYTISISYDASTRLLSDDLKAEQRFIATKGDNDVVKLQFTINDPEHELDGFDRRVDFDIKAKEGDDTEYKPFLMLDENDCATLPNDILTYARKFKMPIQLVFEDPKTHERLCSFNTLTYLVSCAVKGKRITNG